MTSVDDKRVQQTETLAAQAFAQHTITERLRVGLYRAWRCQRPGSWAYGFDITLIPGSLIVTGDLGDMIVSREEDMLPWCRRAVESLEYFSEKVQAISTREGVREFSPEVFEAWATEELLEREAGDPAIAILQEALELRTSVGSGALYDMTADVWQGCDPPRWTAWSHRFLWIREAVRWFVRKYVEPVVPVLETRT